MFRPHFPNRTTRQPKPSRLRWRRGGPPAAVAPSQRVARGGVDSHTGNDGKHLEEQEAK